MRDLSRELNRRAREAAVAGKTDEARRLIEAMKQIADANRRPAVTQLADLCGKAVAEMAEDARSALP